MNILCIYPKILEEPHFEYLDRFLNKNGRGSRAPTALISYCSWLFIGLCHYSSKSLRFAHCQVGQHLAVERDIGLLQGGDQAAVGCAVQPGRRVECG